MARQKAQLKKEVPRSRSRPPVTFAPPVTISNRQLLLDGSDNNFRQVIYLFVKVLGRLMTCRDAFGRRIDLTGSQFAVLMGVAYSQGSRGVTLKELSRHVHLASTHVTTAVGRLTTLGLLDKRSGEDDRRNVLVSLTADGVEAVKRVTPLVRKINDLLFSEISASELLAAQATFARISTNSEAALAEIKRFEQEGTI
jgi:MarR family transcriptional regulator, organic hydroperoxide resistance regulator